MADGLFTPSGDGRVMPTEHARGPWDPRALHGGAAAALITRAFERMEPTERSQELVFARLGFEFLKPIPFAELEVRTSVVRDGRRVQELAAELRAFAPAAEVAGGGQSAGGAGDAGGEADTHGAGGAGDVGDTESDAGGELIGRASALRIKAVPAGLPDPESRRQQPGPEPVRELPGHERGEKIVFALNDLASTSLATTGMEMSWISDPWSLGPGKVWMRPREPIVPGEPASPLARLVATADFGNGISRELEFDKYLFINADLAIHLWRAPRSEWIGLDAKTVLMDGGVGTSESVLHDEAGPVGRAYQALVVQSR